MFSGGGGGFRREAFRAGRAVKQSETDIGFVHSAAPFASDPYPYFIPIIA